MLPLLLFERMAAIESLIDGYSIDEGQQNQRRIRREEESLHSLIVRAFGKDQVRYVTPCVGSHSHSQNTKSVIVASRFKMIYW